MSQSYLAIKYQTLNQIFNDHPAIALPKYPRNNQTSLQVTSRYELLYQKAAMMVLPAPGSSASKNLSGWRATSLHRRLRFDAEAVYHAGVYS